MVAITACSSVAATVVKIVSYISARDYDPIPAFFAPGAQWWIAGDPTLPGDAGGWEPATEYIGTLQFAKTYDAYSFSIKNQVTEDKKSIIEGQVVATKAPDLRHISNLTMAFTFDVYGNVTEVHEYSDRIETNHVIQWMKDHNITRDD